MNEPMSQKEMLMVMLMEIHDQLEELEMVLDNSFSNLRIELEQKEIVKLKMPEDRLTVLEGKMETLQLGDSEVEKTGDLPVHQMKLKLGF
jgi:hypothetical protein